MYKNIAVPKLNVSVKSDAKNGIRNGRRLTSQIRVLIA